MHAQTKKTPLKWEGAFVRLTGEFDSARTRRLAFTDRFYKREASCDSCFMFKLNKRS